MTIEAPVRPANINAGRWRVEILDHTARAESWVGNAVRYDWLGEAWEAGKELLSRWSGPQRFRVMLEGDPDEWADSGCAQCPEAMKGGMYPTHHINRSCESGQRPHCTCDRCF